MKCFGLSVHYCFLIFLPENLGLSFGLRPFYVHNSGYPCFHASILLPAFLTLILPKLKKHSFADAGCKIPRLGVRRQHSIYYDLNQLAVAIVELDWEKGIRQYISEPMARLVSSVGTQNRCPGTEQMTGLTRCAKKKWSNFPGNNRPTAVYFLFCYSPKLCPHIQRNPILILAS